MLFCTVGKHLFLEEYFHFVSYQKNAPNLAMFEHADNFQLFPEYKTTGNSDLLNKEESKKVL